MAEFAEFTHVQLQKAREDHVPKMQQWRLAHLVGVSESTVQRWESGDQIPEPDDISKIEKALGRRDIWHRWMLSHYDSYRERYTDMPAVGHIAADVCRMEEELDHVLPLIKAMRQDAIDGKWDDVALCKVSRKELLEAMEAMRQVLDTMPQGDG